MLNIKVKFYDTNITTLENILSSSFLFDKDLSYLTRFKVEETKKEKASSLIFKNKYIGEYHLNEFGKPLSEDINFNISHSKGVVVFVKDKIPIGIDIEKIRPVENSLVEYISSNEEREYIKSDINFYEIWTNKESLTKAIGTGIKTKIKDIPGLPINGKKTYQEKYFYSKTIKYKDYIISVTRENNEPFEIEIEEERI